MISRTAGWLSVACGVAGLLIALAAIAGVWIARAQVVALADDVDRRLDRAEASLAQARTRLDGIRAHARQLAERGGALVQSGAMGREAVEAYESRLQSMRGAVFTARRTAQGWLMLGAITLTLVCLYGALTHAALIVYGRGHLQRLAQGPQASGAIATDLRSEQASTT